MRSAPVALLVFALGCSCEPEGHEDAPGAHASPVDPLEGLTPWSDAWILAHAPLYVDGSREDRHAALEASLTSHENTYANTRLLSYAMSRGGWDGLPEWSPRTVPLRSSDLALLARGEALHLAPDAPRLPTGPRTSTWEDVRALGQRVFFELPLRAEPSIAAALADEAQRTALGLEVAPDGTVPGVVLFRSVSGADEIGITCALCHAATEDGRLVSGRARRRLDFGRIRLGALEARGPVEERLRARYLSWGPGRADVLEQISEVPIAIPDLWALRDVHHFTQGGTITHVSPISLAIRQETQFIQANHLATRPPRALMFALVVYLYSLSPPPRPEEPASAEETARRERGALVFASECGSCHGHAGFTGDLVPIAEIGTDSELALGEARGTGSYRPQPLLDVRDAAPYLHHGVVPTLEAMLSPARLESDYAGGTAGPGPIPGHAYGLELTDDERSALLAHLRTL